MDCDVGFGRAEACLSGKPLQITTWENYNFQTITFETASLHMENSIAESFACFPQTEICITDMCFVPSQSHHNPRRLLTQQKTHCVRQ